MENSTNNNNKESIMDRREFFLDMINTWKETGMYSEDAALELSEGLDECYEAYLTLARLSNQVKYENGDIISFKLFLDFSRPIDDFAYVEIVFKDDVFKDGVFIIKKLEIEEIDYSHHFADKYVCGDKKVFDSFAEAERAAYDFYHFAAWDVTQ